MESKEIIRSNKGYPGKENIIEQKLEEFFVCPSISTILSGDCRTLWEKMTEFNQA